MQNYGPASRTASARAQWNDDGFHLKRCEGEGELIVALSIVILWILAPLDFSQFCLQKIDFLDGSDGKGSVDGNDDGNRRPEALVKAQQYSPGDLGHWDTVDDHRWVRNLKWES